MRREMFHIYCEQDRGDGNPASPKFGQLVFEHDGCGCDNHEKQFGNEVGTSWVAENEDSQ